MLVSGLTVASIPASLNSIGPGLLGVRHRRRDLPARESGRADELKYAPLAIVVLLAFSGFLVLSVPSLPLAHASPPSLVQKAVSSGCVVKLKCNVAFPGSVTAGDILVMMFDWTDPGTGFWATITVNDTLDNAWQAMNPNAGGGSAYGSTTTTCQSGATVGSGVAECTEYTLSTGSGSDTVTVPEIEGAVSGVALTVSISEFSGVSKLQSNRVLGYFCETSGCRNLSIPLTPGAAVSPLCGGASCTPNWNVYNSGWLVVALGATTATNQITAGPTGFSHVSGCGNNSTICVKYLSASSSAGPTYGMTASASCSSAYGCWQEIVLMFTVPVTLPVKLLVQGGIGAEQTTMDIESGGAQVNSSTNGSLGNCDASPLTLIPGDGSTADLSIAQSCYTFMTPIQPGPWTFLYAAANTSASVHACASGTCPTLSIDYWPINEDFAFKVIPLSPSTWDGAYTIKVNSSVTNLTFTCTFTTSIGSGSHTCGMSGNYNSFIVYPTHITDIPTPSKAWVSNGSSGPILTTGFTGVAGPVDYSLSGPAISITIETSPLDLKNSLTVQGTPYMDNPIVLTETNGTVLSLSAASTALKMPGFFLYTFSHWSQGGAQDQSYTVTGNATLIAYYVNGGISACSTYSGSSIGQLESQLNHGCEWSVVFYSWFGLFGPWILAFIDFMPALAIYLRTESPGAAIGVYVLIDVVLVFGLTAASVPASINTVAPGLLGAVVAGGIFQLLRSGKGG